MAPRTAPHRCFLGDVPLVLHRYATENESWESHGTRDAFDTHETNRGAYHWDEPCVAPPTRAVGPMESSVPRRASRNHDQLTLRLLGTIVHLCHCQRVEPAASAHNAEACDAMATESLVSPSRLGDDMDDLLVQIHVDDGTGIACIRATSAMVAHVALHVGLTLDSVVSVHSNGAPSHSNDSNGVRSGDCSHILVALQLVVSNVHAETVRWLELTVSTFPTLGTWGYPTRTVTCDDVFGIIESESRHGLCTNANANASKQHSLQQPLGVSTTDVAECLNVSLDRVDELLQELQAACQIYRNEHGRFISL